MILPTSIELRVSLRHALRCQSILKKMDEEAINNDKARITSSEVIDVLSETLLGDFVQRCSSKIL